MEEEIDLREYIAVLLKYWKWIIGLSLAAAIAAFIVSTFLTPTYQATANVIILKSKTEISLEPKFQTTTGDQNVAAKVNQDTLVSLVTSSDVAALVLEAKGDLLEPETRKISTLLKKIEAANTGDVITIQLTDQSPEVASELANAWAAAYETYVNQLFSNRSDQLLVEVQDQMQEVSQAYRLAQDNWEQFLSNNDIAVLEREIAVKQGRADALKEAELTLLDRELVIKQDEANALRTEDATLERVPLFLYNLSQNSARDTLTHKYEELQQMEKWLEDAHTMRDQLAQQPASSAASAGDALALINLRSRVLASSVASPIQIQLNFASIAEPTASVEDVDSLITVIETRKAGIEQDIATLSNELLLTAETDIPLSPRSKPLSERVAAMDNETLLLVGAERWYPRSEALTRLIDTLDADIQTLQAEQEARESQRRELRQTRDLAWDNLTTVQRKQAEVQLASQFTDSQVRVAARAVPPEKPIGPKRLLNTAIAGALALMLAVFAVFALEYWRSDNQLPAQPDSRPAPAANP